MVTSKKIKMKKDLDWNNMQNWKDSLIKEMFQSKIAS